VAVLQPDGKVKEWLSEGRSFQGALALSRDGRRLAAVVTNGDGIDEVYLGDTAHPGLRRFAAIPSVDLDFPRFTPDGEALILTRTSRSEEDGLYLYPLSGAPARRILKTGSPGGWTMAVGWTPDGDLLVARNGKGSTVIGRLSLDKGEDPSSLRTFFDGKADFGVPDFSPDGRMVAYPSNESGKFEVYVAPYADGAIAGRAVNVSRGLGYRPLWSRDGRSLTYISGEDKVMRMTVDSKTGYPTGDAVEIAFFGDLNVAQTALGFEAGPDSNIYFIRRGAEEGAVKGYDLVLNWFTELNERLAAARPSRR
jgi:Tol biopolymer transport system component